MATIQAQQDYLMMLKRDVQTKWIAACEADGIDVASKFVVFSNTLAARQYNEAMGLFLKARKKFHNQIMRNLNRRARHEAHTSLGLKRVRGTQGGVYYE